MPLMTRVHAIARVIPFSLLVTVSLTSHAHHPLIGATPTDTTITDATVIRSLHIAFVQIRSNLSKEAFTFP